MNTYHFIGIGGISMSALAHLVLKSSDIVQGSDIKKNAETEILERLGVKIFYGHNKKNIFGANIVVSSGAIADSNPELKEAKSMGIKIMSRGELLGELAKKYKNVIAISGAHGKTSTTEMLAEIFEYCGKNPTVHLGGISNSFGSNLKIGGKKFFITEACEYKNSFLSLAPSFGVILNVEPEHLDFFKTFKNVKESFANFEKHCKKCIKLTKKRGIYQVFLKNVFFEAKNISHLGHCHYGYDLFKNNKFLGKVELGAFGKHNVPNSLCAIIAALEYKLPFKKIVEALKNYKGVKRRFEVVSKRPLVIHDYAHHPTEIAKTIASAKKIPHKKLIVAFQPHTFSRTLSLKNEFVRTLGFCDKLFLIKTYSAREKPLPGGSAKDLAALLPHSTYCGSMEKAYSLIGKTLCPNDILLILGAGNINELAEMYKKYDEV